MIYRHILSSLLVLLYYLHIHIVLPLLHYHLLNKLYAININILNTTLYYTVSFNLMASLNIRH